MPNSRTWSGSETTGEVLGRLQGAMLEAVLTGSPLPGHSRALALPDLPLVLRQPDVILSISLVPS